MDESKNLDILLECIEFQTYNNFKVWFCVNQPDDFWNKQDKKHICLSNEKSLKRLNQVDDFNIEIIDRSSPGKGWQGKNSGVGIARKTLMDSISEEAGGGDIIVSLDGDTTFDKDYFLSLAENFAANNAMVALSVPYYHRLTGDEVIDRAILRYEIYMRHYELNLRRIGSPYAFTALGSAMACRVDTYRNIGGMTPKKSGEDFYFLQKIAKYKKVHTRNREKVYPAARFSDRVFFGTGPAMIKGAKGDWSSYPVYSYKFFDELKSFFENFPRLYDEDIENPGDDFLEPGWYLPLRANATSREAFVRACHHKFDGLRTLQYLKARQKEQKQSDEENFIAFAAKFYPAIFPLNLTKNLSFASSPVELLNEIRNLLTDLLDS